MDAEKEKALGAKFIAVNYEDADALAVLLEQNQVQTVISTVNSPAGPANELSMIAAADKSSTTTRFIPAIWGLPYTEE